MADYMQAARVACPRCRAAAGDPCRERYCRSGRRNCDYAVCSAVRDLPEPHPARLARAALASHAPSAPTTEDGQA